MYKKFLFLLWILSGSLGIVMFALLLVVSSCRYHLDQTLRPLFQRSRWDDAQSNLSATYYERDCSIEDLSTRNLADLFVPGENSTKENSTNDSKRSLSADRMMTHGVLIFPSMVDKETVASFRNYTLQKNEILQPEEAVFVMNTHTKKLQTRWSFAFEPADHEAIPALLRQVAHHELLQETLEMFLGPDPAIIKMQTITSRYKAEHQGWHPDVNSKTSILSHARNFMKHFSLFIPLQDTAPRMGSTGICPGSHFCTTIDSKMQDSCIQVASSLGDDGTDQTINKSGMIWRAGDAVLMNQNTWHRGWKHNKWGGPDRVIVVITFTSRPRRRTDSRQKQRPLDSYISKLTLRGTSDFSFPVELNGVETRMLSIGTPLSSFGFTMNDMKDSLKGTSFPMKWLRILGIYKPSDANWGWDYVSSLFSRISAESNGFKRDDLSALFKRLSKDRLMGQFLLNYFVENRVPPKEDNRGTWEVWYSLSLQKAQWTTFRLLLKLFIIHLGVLWVTRSMTEFKLRRKTTMWVGAWNFSTIMILILFVAGNACFFSSPMVQEIKTGAKLRTSFPNMIFLEPSGSISLFDPESVFGGKKCMKGGMKPKRSDILVGTRFQSPYLRLMNKFLDYHPGNRQFNEFLDFHVKHQLCSSCPKALQELSLQNFRESINNRFLLQCPYSGTFAVMSEDEIERYLRRIMACKRSSSLDQVHLIISFMVAGVRFESKQRATNIALMTVAVLGDLLEKIVGANSSHNTKPRKLQRAHHFQVKPVAICKKIELWSHPTKPIGIPRWPQAETMDKGKGRIDALVAKHGNVPRKSLFHERRRGKRKS